MNVNHIGPLHWLKRRHAPALASAAVSPGAVVARASTPAWFDPIHLFAAWARESVTSGARFFSFVVGLDQFLVGLTMLVLPAQFAAPSYDFIRPYLTPLGIAFLLCGLLLLTSNLLPAGRLPLARLALLLAVVTFGVFMSQAAIRPGLWTGVVTYGLLITFCLALAAGLDRRIGAALDSLTALLLIDRAAQGTLLLAAHRQFAPSLYDFVRPHLMLWGYVMLLCGLLLAMRLVWVARPSTRLLPAIVAALMLGWVYAVFVRGNGVTGVINNGLLALGVGVRPWLPQSWLMLPRGRLAAKLIVAASLFTVAVLVVIATVLLQRSESIYRQRAEQEFVGLAQVSAYAADSFVQDQMQTAQAIAQAPVMRSMDPGR